MSREFELRTVAHLMRPWGRPASDLEQLRAGLAAAPDEVLFRHVVQYPLRNPGAETLDPDDLSAWVGGVAQDHEVAERLTFVVHTRHESPAMLRAALLAVLDSVSGGRRWEHDVREGSEFVFLSAISLSFPTGRIVRDPAELVDALIHDDPATWFYHLIEEPWYRGRAPLLEWLAAGGHRRLVTMIEEAIGSGRPLDRARAQLDRRWRRRQIAHRVAEATRESESERREAGREVVARLVRRRTHTDEPA